jgi:ATP-dependent helicase HrpA
VAREVLGRLNARGAAAGGSGLLAALAAEQGRHGGMPVPEDAFDLGKLPPHLRLRFRVTGERGEVLADGQDLGALRAELAPRLRAAVAAAAPAELTRTGVTRWDFASLPRVFSSGQVLAYPALADRGDAVDVVLCETPAAAGRSMLAGNRRLLLLAVPSGARAVASRLPSGAKLALSRSPYASAGALIDDCAAAAADAVVVAVGGPAWDKAAFDNLLEAARLELRARTADAVSAAATVMTRAHQVEVALDRTSGAAADDLRAQFAGLIYSGFVSDAGAQRLSDLDRYLRAMLYRLERYDPGKDAGRMAVVHRVAAEYERVLAGLDAGQRASDEVRAVRWMIEELRVSLFAQSLGAVGPISEQRIASAMARLRTH